MEFDFLDARPIVIAIAGSNGAGKTTFFHSHLAQSGLHFVNADELASDLELGPYEAAAAATVLRSALIKKRESFIFETVFSDPVGDKVEFLKNAVEQGYEVVLIFMQIPNAEISEQRVSMRVAQGGHDVPNDKLQARFSRTLKNLEKAIESLPWVIVYDNADLQTPFAHVVTYRDGTRLNKGI